MGRSFLALLVLLCSEATAFHINSIRSVAKHGCVFLRNSHTWSAAKDPSVTPAPASFVVLGNLQSGPNIGRIVRSAAIFGATEVIVVGQRKYSIFGDHGTRFSMPMRHCYTHTEAAEYLKEVGAKVIGV